MGQDEQMHTRLAVSQTSTPGWSLDEELSFYEQTGISSVGLDLAKLMSDADRALDPEALKTRFEDAGIRITSLSARCPFDLSDPTSWTEAHAAIDQMMDIALALHPDTLVMSTGSVRGQQWERAADALGEALAPISREAEREGLVVAIEHTNPLHADRGFVHTLRDALELSWRLDTGVCMTVDACWAERNLAGMIASSPERIRVVRIADLAESTDLVGANLVPGDGSIPLRRILGHLLEASYEGPFEVSITGPAIEQEGFARAIGRALTNLDAILRDLEGTEEPQDP